jgi:hypothetical protein
VGWEVYSLAPAGKGRFCRGRVPRAAHPKGRRAAGGARRSRHPRALISRHRQPLRLDFAAPGAALTPNASIFGISAHCSRDAAHRPGTKPATPSRARASTRGAGWGGVVVWLRGWRRPARFSSAIARRLPAAPSPGLITFIIILVTFDRPSHGPLPSPFPPLEALALFLFGNYFRPAEAPNGSSSPSAAMPEWCRRVKGVVEILVDMNRDIEDSYVAIRRP